MDDETKQEIMKLKSALNQLRDISVQMIGEQDDRGNALWHVFTILEDLDIPDLLAAAEHDDLPDFFATLQNAESVDVVRVGRKSTVDVIFRDVPLDLLADKIRNIRYLLSEKTLTSKAHL